MYERRHEQTPSSADGASRAKPDNQHGVRRKTATILMVALLSVFATAFAGPAEAGTAGPGYTIGTVSGSEQTARVGERFAGPLVMYVTDDVDSPAPDIPLTFTVQQGSVRFGDGTTRVTVSTDAAGHASVDMIAGPTAGEAIIVVTTPNFPNPLSIQENVVAGSTVRLVGSGTLPLGSENATFSLDLTSTGSTASGSCQLTGQTTNVRCTSFSNVQRNGKVVTFRGTGLYNNRQPISFSAQVTDGSPDSFVIFGAGQRFGGSLTSGNITIT